MLWSPYLTRMTYKNEHEEHKFYISICPGAVIVLLAMLEVIDGLNSKSWKG